MGGKISLDFSIFTTHIISKISSLLIFSFFLLVVVQFLNSAINNLNTLLEMILSHLNDLLILLIISFSISSRDFCSNLISNKFKNSNLLSIGISAKNSIHCSCILISSNFILSILLIVFNFSSILLKNSSNGTVMYEFLVILDIRLTLLKPAFLLVYKIGLALLDEYFSHPLAIAANKDKLFLSFL